ncbi:survival protein sure-like phosphatase/nucleotidase [Gilbertella persicaria]|uniref:survival protein sure-like phosphatase/nucleotidase n=1 Tax=Gilbertella persicaria TaxID=101096 RepID=UPI00221F6F01|nr:survival protein sure-like phosphatase/nucleotidase [Gilbertella persicaria]KAI8083986.1 survival protein sure-like phosphatase/nucleotidase [Gilbertella persicaria]
MKVLICNDDGPPSWEESPFILPFVQHLESLGWEVKVCLPDSQKSWIAKSFLIKDEIYLRYFNRITQQITVEKENENDFFLLSGTPATCVNIALNHLFRDQAFDLVISGPNFGRNFSNLFTLASGTVGAATEAVLNHQKAVSVSFCFCNKRPECIQNCCETASDIIEHLVKLDTPWPSLGSFNINIPMTDTRRPVQLTRFYNTRYGSLFERNKNKFRFKPDFAQVHQDQGVPGTDQFALMNQFVSVTPMIAAFQEANVDDLDFNFDALNKQ